ncbi:hypothetical protein UFOVP71_108 [uncultured Caudovirales phage]|uniref:Uncharacterized protein n=1 Tax=uncultured Caudovirales phage TaxID=2100421 RepID=A0A6J5TD68_9CAUD|nr:hypothetical protein UFOVP71_108 [uncultured Caudovirales phage]
MMNNDFFVPLSLKLPNETKELLREFFLSELHTKQSSRKQLGLYPTPRSIELETLVDDFLGPIGLKAGAYGTFALQGSTRDKNIHVDAMKLNTRLSFYELAETPGEIHWYSDEHEGYEAWKPSYLGGEPILDYRYRWVDELQRGKRTWEDCPAPIHTESTNVPSALVMTALPHNVVQGPGFRITVSCQVLDRNTGAVENTWQRVKDYFNSTASPASAS